MTEQREQREPLWTEEAINARISEILANYTHTPRGLARRIAYEVRDFCLADRAALLERVTQLEDTLAFAAQHRGIEARACPLCKYENGKFIEHCQMHKDMKELRADRAALLERIAELEVGWDEAGRYVVELETKVEALEAELAALRCAEWEPLPPGKYADGYIVLDEDGTITAFSNDGSNWISFELLSDWRLWRKKARA